MRHAVADLLRCPFSGGPFAVEALAEDADHVEHGVLRSEAGAFPVVAGIPVLLADQGELVDLLRSGEHDLATRRAAFGSIPPSGWRRTGTWLQATDRLRAAGRRIEAGHRRDLDRRSAPLLDPSASVQDLFALAYRELHLRNPEVYAYNWYRFGLPRHLAALAAIEWSPRRGPVLDLGCGAGHLTWALSRRLGGAAPVIGVDGLYFALWVARHRIAPAADYVCGELESLPLPDGTVGGVWASDVFHAISRKAQVAREIRRVSTSEAWGAVVGLAVAGHDHEYAGRPLSAEGYRHLFPAGAALVDDAALVAAYLDRRSASRQDVGDLAAAPTVTALWAPADDGAEGQAFDDWPHGRGATVPHPLLTPDGRTDDGTRVSLAFPTPSFEREHGALRAYTPDAAEVPDAVVEAVLAGQPDDALDRLVEAFVLLGVPEGYLEDPWAGFGPGA